MRGSTRIAAATRSPAAGYIDLGNEPPLAVGQPIEPEKGEPTRNSISVRWLGGTMLTGVASTLLMGGALLVALNGQDQLAAAPQRMVAEAGAIGGMASGTKGDRIQPVEAEVVSREILQVSTITREDNRDLIKTRPFVSIHATLSTQRSEFADEIPQYDPLAILGSGPAEGEGEDATAMAATDQIYGAEVDGKIAIQMSAFPLDAPGLSEGGEFEVAEVEEIVRNASRFIGDGGIQQAAIAYVDPDRFAFDEADDPFAALGVRIIPENVSFIAKSDQAADPLPGPDERVIAIADRQTLEELLVENAVSTDEAARVSEAMGTLVDLSTLDEKCRIRLAYAGTGVEGDVIVPLRISVYAEGVHQATVARTDEGDFVRADEPSALPDDLAEYELADNDEGQMPRLYDAVYQTALEQQVPVPLVKELIRIFAYDVDFQARISPGDSLEVLHSMPDASNASQGEGIVFAALTINGNTRRFYRYQTPDDGVVDWYDEDGASARKFLMQKPMSIGQLRSGFGSRRHPILGYRKMHTGVDWAAPSGTPIMASGDGVVVSASRTSGYGNYTRIRHTNGYETAYAHQSRFAPGIVPGARVRQGQIIGYVGSTGLSTGPHLHYEVRINNTLVDPLGIRLPRGRALQGEMLDEFERERARIDNLLGRQDAPTQTAAR